MRTGRQPVDEQVTALARDLLEQPPVTAVVGPFDDEDALPSSVRA